MNSIKITSLLTILALPLLFLVACGETAVEESAQIPVRVFQADGSSDVVYVEQTEDSRQGSVEKNIDAIRLNAADRVGVNGMRKPSSGANPSAQCSCSGPQCYCTAPDEPEVWECGCPGDDQP